MKDFVKPFVDVTTNIFKAFVGCGLNAEHAFFSNREIDIQSDISGVIGLSGSVRGAVILIMKEPVALRIASMLTGSVHTSLDSDVVDAIGEITNIIAGNAKQTIPDGEGIVISLPTVIRGVDHSIVCLSKQRKILCIPFRIFEEDTLHLEVAIDPEINAREA